MVCNGSLLSTHNKCLRCCWWWWHYFRKTKSRTTIGCCISSIAAEVKLCSTHLPGRRHRAAAPAGALKTNDCCFCRSLIFRCECTEGNNKPTTISRYMQTSPVFQTRRSTWEHRGRENRRRNILRSGQTEASHHRRTRWRGWLLCVASGTGTCGWGLSGKSKDIMIESCG